MFPEEAPSPLDRFPPRAARAIIACALLLCGDGCKAGDTWPELPRSDEEAQRTFAAATDRPATKDEAPFQREATSAFVMSSLPSGVATKDGVAGWEMVDERLGSWVDASPDRSAVVAFGVSNDSPEQLDAFRRLVGARSRVRWTRMLIEHLHTDGHWKDLEPAIQVGDDVVLDRFARGGSRDTLTPLIARVERDTNTPWKFGSGNLLVEVVAEARASGRAVSGCGMSAALRARAANLGEDALQRTRVLHCALALRDRTRKDEGVARVAALWERTHVHQDRFPRLAPPGWTKLRVLIMDAPADDRIVLVDPILTTGGVLLLPSPSAETRFERRLSRVEAPRSAFRSTTKKTLRDPTALLDGVPFDGSKPVAAGKHFLVVDKSGTTIAGIVDVPALGALDVQIADEAPDVTVTLVSAKAP